MINTISANDLKTRGVKIIEEIASTSDVKEVLVNVHGKNKYAILPIEYYNQLRELEIEQALRESLEDIKLGKYNIETADQHINSIDK